MYVILSLAGYSRLYKKKRVVFPRFSCMRSYPQRNILQIVSPARIMTLIVSLPYALDGAIASVLCEWREGHCFSTTERAFIEKYIRLILVKN